MSNKHYGAGSYKMVDKEGKEHLLTVERDDYAEDPRYWDNLCTMTCWHRSYRLGDKHNYDGIEDFFQTLCKEVLNKGYDETHILNYNGDLYGQDIALHLLGFVREERRFKDINELQAAITQDKKKIVGDYKWF